MRTIDSAKFLITSLAALALWGLGLSLFPSSARAESSLSTEEKIVKRLPSGSKEVKIDGKNYWVHDGIYYRRTEGGYEALRTAPSKGESTTTDKTKKTKGEATPTKSYDVTKDGTNPKAESTTPSSATTKDKTKNPKGEVTTTKGYDLTKDGTNPKAESTTPSSATTKDKTKNSQGEATTTKGYDLTKNPKE